jgi:hypothetical protein
MSDHYSFGGFGYMFIQCAMFFLRYGMKYQMPDWVTWFPTIIVGLILAVVAIVFIILLIGAMIE